jgi:RHS repeat-associated protein
MDDPTLGAEYTYDTRGRLAATTDANGATVAYGYDADGNRNRIVYPSGRTVTYGYDPADRPVSVAADGAAIITAADYLPFGPAARLAFGNSTTKTMTYDLRYRPLEYKLTRPAGTIADYTYTSDAGSNVTSIHDLTSAAYNRDFAYDDLNRLTAANSGASLWGAATYTYDAMGNMTAQHLGNRTLTFSYIGTTPKLQLVNGTSGDFVTYDSAGNETSLGTYGARNLFMTTGPRKYREIMYSYDGRGVRVASTVVNHGVDPYSEIQTSVYSPELQLLARSFRVAAPEPGTIDAGGPPPFDGTDFIWFAGQPVAQASTDPSVPLRFTFTDHLGTPILQTDSTAQIVWRAEYEPFGNIFTYRTGDADDPQILRLPGQEHEALTSTDNTDVNYNIFRWYRSGWGRYTPADPLFGRDPNANDAYGYAKENPLSFTDPTGLLAEAICSKIAVGGIATPLYHCRLRVTCKECTPGKFGGPFDTTVGLERNRKTGDLEINEMGSYAGDKRVDLGISEADSCNFGRCVRSNAAFFQPFAKGWKSQYSLGGPNSNTFVGHLARTCGSTSGGPWLAPGWGSEFFKY